MRRHLELGLTLGALALALGGAACSREADRTVDHPKSTAVPVPVSYSEANKTSTTATPNTPSAGVGYDSSQKQTPSSSSSTMDNGGYDYSGVPNTGATDNVPSGIGGGPADASGKNYRPGAANDDNTDDSLAPDKGKDKSDEVKPEKPKPKKPKSK